MKGLSPLIGAVFLIVFTVLIAGILATFATNLTREQIATTGEEALCIGSLDLSTLSFNAGTDEIIFRLRNTVFRSDLILENLSVVVEFNVPSDNTVYDDAHADITGLQDLSPSETVFVTIGVSGKSDPKNIEVVAANCPRSPAKLTFR